MSGLDILLPSESIKPTPLVAPIFQAATTQTQAFPSPSLIPVIIVGRAPGTIILFISLFLGISYTFASSKYFVSIFFYSVNCIHKYREKCFLKIL